MSSSFGVSLPVIGMNNGFLGDPTRTGPRSIVARPVSLTAPTNIFFGDAVTILPDSTGGTLISVRDFITANGAAAMTPDLFAGVAVREVKTELAYSSLRNLADPPIGSYAPGEMAEYHTGDGSINIACLVGNPVAEAPVYLRTALNGGNAGVVGGFEAAPDAAAVAAAVAGNTGNGTVTAGPTATGPLVQGGVYHVLFNTATTYSVYDPNNNLVGNGTTGVAFTSKSVGFTITAGGTAFVKGDGFTVTVTSKTILLPFTNWRTGVLDPNDVCEITMRIRLSA